MTKKLWLWKNFAGGRPEYLAFDNPYPCEPDGNPSAKGDPCGYAVFKESSCGFGWGYEVDVLQRLAAQRKK